MCVNTCRVIINRNEQNEHKSRNVRADFIPAAARSTRPFIPHINKTEYVITLSLLNGAPCDLVMCVCVILFAEIYNARRILSSLNGSRSVPERRNKSSGRDRRRISRSTRLGSRTYYTNDFPPFAFARYDGIQSLALLTRSP